MKFGGQTSKNVHDVQKVCLETTLCVYACFVKFYVFVLDENHVRGTKIIYEENIQRTIQGYLRRSQAGAQDCPTNGWHSTPTGSVDAPLVVSCQLGLMMGRG